MYVLFLNFNSIKVQLRPRLKTNLGEKQQNFNSIKVQLRLTVLASCLVHRLFQFHKGTIKTDILSIFAVLFHDFNSIKVQLRR